LVVQVGKFNNLTVISKLFYTQLTKVLPIQFFQQNFVSI